MGFISVRESAHLKATVLAMQSADRGIQAGIRKSTKEAAAPIWRQELDARPATVAQSRMLVETARVQVSNNTVTLTSAASSRKVLSGGARPNQHGKAFEFGSNRGHGRQLPPPRRGGYVVYPALADVAPRIISLWTQTTMKIAHDALEGRRT